METITGAVLGQRYEVGEAFLKCRFSVLHRGLDHQTSTPVVLRLLMLPDGVAEDERAQIQSQFYREAQVLMRLVHRHLPRVLDTLSDGNALVTVMEPFEGNTLEYVSDHMSVRPGQKLLGRWMDQIAAALQYLHEQDPPIVYRDLSPQSVLLTPHALIKLVDFGLARMVDRATQATMLRAHGSTDYSAPEQLTAGSRSEPRTDLYSLGATIYRLASGVPPPSAWARSYDQEPLLRIAALNSQLSEPFCDIISKLLTLKRDDRPASAAEVRALVAPFIGAPAAPAPAAPSPADRAAMARANAAQLSAAVSVSAPPPPLTGTPTEPPPQGGTPTLPPNPAVAWPPPSEGWPSAAPVIETAPPPEPPPTIVDAAEWDVPTVKIDKAVPADTAVVSTSGWNLLRMLPWMGKSQPRKETSASASAGTADSDGQQYPYIDLATLQLDIEVAQILPESIAARIGGVCVARTGKDITLAVKQPEVYIYDHIAYATRGMYKPTLMRADAESIDLALDFVYHRSQKAENVTWLEWLEKKKFHQQDLSIILAEEQQRLLQSEDVVRGPAVAMVDRMIKEAISVQASDIHIETYEKEVVLRYRIDGILHVMDAWPRQQAAAYIKRVKILANMDIAQELLPQGGRISVRVSDKEYDLRVSCVPVADGESIVMRLLSKGTFDLKLADLGFGGKNEDIFRRLINQPHGMVLVSGPTGSGKSTTLYAALAEINRPDRKILTVEDPIEYKMPGVVQVQVNMAPREEEKRLTFARALREFLRQDPDVILVGEIRDDETAAISVQAALTGHLVLSTIHTNDAVGIVTRLRDRGIETFLLSTTLVGGIAQRLIRRICKACKTEIVVPDGLRPMFAQEGISEPHMFVGKGCLKCHDTGYKGRVAIHEVLEVNEDLRDLIGSGANGGEMLRAAQKAGFKTLFQDGLQKVNDGVATLEEVKRVCMSVGDPVAEVLA